MAAAAKAQSDQYLAEIDAQIEASKKLNEEEEKLAEARIQRMVDTGQITEEEGNRRKHLEQEAVGAANANLDAQKERERIAEKERQLAEAKTRLPQEQHEQAATVFAAEVTIDEKKRFEDAAKEATKQAEDARAALTKRQGEVRAESAGQGVAGFVDRAAATVGGMLPGIDATQMMAGIKAGNERALERQTKVTELLESRAAHLQALIDGDTKAAAAAKKHADNLEKQIEEDKKLVATSPAEIESAQRIAQTREEAASRALQLQGRTHEDQEASDEAKRRRKLQAAIQVGHATPQQWADWQNQQSQDSWSQTSGSDAALDLGFARQSMSDARSGVRNHTESAAQLQTLLNEFLGLARDLHATSATRSQYEELSRQVATLQTQIATNR